MILCKAQTETMHCECKLSLNKARYWQIVEHL